MNFVKKADNVFEKFNIIFLLLIVGVYAYTRNKYLGETSYYMHIDELRAAYDARCLAAGNEPISSGMTLYVLLGALMFKIKGGLFSLKLFRLIAVAAGLFGMIFSYLTVYEMTHVRKYAFLEAVVVTTLPVFFIPERTGIPANMFMYLIPAVFWLLLRAKDRTGLQRAVYATLSGAAVVILIVLSRDAGSLFDRGSVLNNIKNIKGILWDDGHPYNISPTFGTVYVFSLPVLIAGVVLSFNKLVRSIKEKVCDANTILWVYTILALVFVILHKDADIRTAGPLFFAASLFITEGLIWVCNLFKGALIVETAIFLTCFFVFTGYYYENFNSEVNNSSDHEAGIVVDKSVGEAIKATIKELPGREISVITPNFDNRNLMIALYGNATLDDYKEFADLDEFSFGNISVTDSMDPEPDGAKAYIIDQYVHQDIVDELTGQGWKCIYLKEFTICFI